MSSVPIQEHELLRAQISQTHAKLGGLEQTLRGLDAKLESMSAQRESCELLEQVCGSLEKLEALGVDELFWGQTGANRTAEHVRAVRDRMSDVQANLATIERQRQALLARISEGQEVLDLLEDDLLELEEEEEERNAEWLIERELVLHEAPMVMPWARGGEDDRRYRKSLSVSLLVAALLGTIAALVELPLPDLELIPEVPERFARLIEQQPLPPPPPPVAELPTEAPEPEPPPEERVIEEVASEVPEAPEPEPTVAVEAPPEPQAPQVRSAGILAFRESFSSLAERDPSRLGASARINDAGQAAVGRTERAMVTSQEPGSSGGINLGSLSRDVGGGGPGIGDVEVARVASSIGPAGNSDRPLSGGAIAGRTDEEIQIVFDRYKAALYRLYNRELRNDPTLQGQVVLELTIEPDGSVSHCVVRSSDMNAPALEQQVVERVLTFDFGAKEGISAITIIYPIDFLPAA
jgi:TonB family protein